MYKHTFVLVYTGQTRMRMPCEWNDGHNFLICDPIWVPMPDPDRKDPFWMSCDKQSIHTTHSIKHGHMRHGEHDHDGDHTDIYREYTVPFRVQHSNTFPLPKKLSFPISLHLCPLFLFLSFPHFFKFSFPNAAPHEIVTHRAACRAPFPFIKTLSILIPRWEMYGSSLVAS